MDDVPVVPSADPTRPGPNQCRVSGTIRVDSKGLKIPADYSTDAEPEGKILGLEPIVAVILLLTLSFMGAITYLISQMPVPVK